MFSNLWVLGGVGIAIVVFLSVFLSMCFRVVVGTNNVDIVQSGKKTVSYGKDQTDGNTYYKWPSWIPFYGVRVTSLPVSVFDIRLDGYAAYDKGRVPFQIDIMAFFRIVDSNMAAQRVNTTEELHSQLQGILQGVCRTILATSEIQEILEGRSQFGKMFTQEVDENLKQWGVSSVKQIELMDIRDAQGSNVISNIMAMKKSLIEKDSRVAVAQNMRLAQVAEVEADQAVKTRQQEAQEAVGIRTAQREQQVGIAAQKSAQAVKLEEKETMSKDMDVAQVKVVRTATINKEAATVTANQNKDVAVVNAEASRAVAVVTAEANAQVAVVQAEGAKKQTILIAEGELEKQTRNAKGIELEGLARGAAETAELMAPITTQITLAKEIGENEGYQKYLIGVKQIEAGQTVGVAQAGALEKADIKIIANSGEVIGGVQKVMDIFSSKGGTAVASALEAFANSPTGGKVVAALTGNKAA